jgi:hypothetical protein
VGSVIAMRKRTKMSTRMRAIIQAGGALLLLSVAAGVSGCGARLNLGSDVLWSAEHESGNLDEWTVPPGSLLRLQQLLAQAGYLPLDWQPFGCARAEECGAPRAAAGVAASRAPLPGGSTLPAQTRPDRSRRGPAARLFSCGNVQRDSAARLRLRLRLRVRRRRPLHPRAITRLRQRVARLPLPAFRCRNLHPTPSLRT